MKTSPPPIVRQPFLPNGGVTTPRGWQAAATACGMRYRGRDDLALLVSAAPCTAAALFTTNVVKSAHILYAQPLMARNANQLQAVVINSGSANACTGQAGVDAAALVARTAAQELALPLESVFVMSTGIIGMPLPLDKIVPGIASAAQQLDAANGYAAARAIMTTDIYPKQCALRVDLPDIGTITIGGMSKGSGMIHPNMATMLGVITTDAALPPSVLDAALRYAADRSFHCISVDGDTSTNDTLLLLANGQAGLPAIDRLATPAGQAFLAALTTVCQHLAREVARDGEGATRFVTIDVRGAPTYADAHRAAMTVARSPLVKTALFGADPNWGRVVCALGYSRAALDPERLVLYFAGVKVFANGMPVEFDEQHVHALLQSNHIEVSADLGLGNEIATVWTCDFSYDYVKINAEYRS